MYFFWIDILRGLAAVSILFWHYPNLYNVDRALMPLYSVFWYLYDYGELAVFLFWVISGFVFTYVYLEHRSTGKEFFMHRFARLYPLHFLTLIMVAALQIISLYQTGVFQIYTHNDLYHFILNIFFIPSWGFQDGRSFNAPVWSVSVELLIYFVFWVSIPFLSRHRLFFSLSAVCVFLAMFFGGIPGSAFWQCGFFFFTGSSLFILVNRFKNNRLFLASISSVLFGISYILFHSEIYRSDLFSYIFGFAGLVLLFAVIDLCDIKKIGKKFKRVGDISYGTYLIHIPIQIGIILLIDALGIQKSIPLSPVFLFFFLLSVIISANVLFVYFENPMRKYFRRVMQ